MALSRKAMLRGMYERDDSLDGRYLVGVASTRIFCLPSCAARKPKPENVIFFLQPDAARAAGYRPCRRCRPDLFYRGADPDQATLVRVVREVSEDPSRFASAADMASATGFGASKLAALMCEHYHLSPARFLMRARVAAASRLLADGASSAADAGFAVGFASLAAFYQNFKRHTGLRPGDYRALRERNHFLLSLPAEYSAEALLHVLGRDPQSQTEQAAGDTVCKALAAHGQTGVLRMRLRDGEVHGQVTSDTAPSAELMLAGHALAVRLLGLRCDPLGLARRVRGRPQLAALIGRRKGLRMSLMGDVFEALTWAIIGQQVNLRFASALRRRLIGLCGATAPGGFRVHPCADRVAQLEPRELRRHQFSQRKAEYLIEAARQFSRGRLPAEQLELAPAARLRHTLTSIRGIGPWTCEYVLMRGLGLEDCVPAGDAGLSAALQRFFTLNHRPDPGETRTLMQPFAPSRSLATQHLWMSLGDAP